MKRVIFILLAVCVLVTDIFAFEIEGYVFDQDSLPLIGSTVRIKGTTRGAIVKNKTGYFKINNIPDGMDSIHVIVTYIGKKRINRVVTEMSKKLYFYMDDDKNYSGSAVMCMASPARKVDYLGSSAGNRNFSVRGSRSNLTQIRGIAIGGFSAEMNFHGKSIDYINESYKNIDFNKFLTTLGNPLSSFSADVDRASYSNIRRMIENGQDIDKDAVKIEEMINYFKYDYPEPDKDKFKVITEYSKCPWNENHNLLMIGLKSKEILKEDLPQSHLVFLLDVSGSMDVYNKLPLVRSSMKMLIEQLDENDRISIVTYAGEEKIVCENVSCSEKQLLIDKINNLYAAGSTHASSGIKVAYDIAEKYFIQNGNNRIILATDGDFNVGIVDEEDLAKLIKEKRENKIYLSCLGFGMGNYKDNKIETLSHHGNGNYAYIDNLLEAKKQLISEMGGTLFTVAKDVKLQLEFNPYYVESYRLIGYENRLMAPEEFQDEKKDAGEVGAGHSLTVLYEIVPNKVDEIISVDSRYIESKVKKEAKNNNEMGTLRIKYKDPKSEKSFDIENIINNKTEELEYLSNDFKFAANVAIFGMYLRKSEYLPYLDYEHFLNSIESSIGEDKEGYRKEFRNLVDLYLNK